MSVILEALQKARSDRKSKPSATEAGTARILEPQSGGPVMLNSNHSRAPRFEPVSGSGRTWVLAVAVVISLMLLLCLIGGMFWLLYDQVRRVNDAAASPQAAMTLSAPAEGPAGALPVALPLPTPLPVQELPVQPPSPAVAASEPPSKAPSAEAPVASPAPEFVLGSIVCEAGDCLASLNGRSVRVGDSVKGWTVVQIETSTLVLQNASGEKRSLSLFD